MKKLEDMTREELMQDAARILALLFGPEVGFFVLATPFGDAQARANYTGNMDRAHTLNILISFLRRSGTVTGWMRHLPGNN